jgi:hypothetical protein
MTQQQEPTARSPGGPRTKTGQGFPHLLLEYQNLFSLLVASISNEFLINTLSLELKKDKIK